MLQYPQAQFPHTLSALRDQLPDAPRVADLALQLVGLLEDHRLLEEEWRALEALSKGLSACLRRAQEPMPQPIPGWPNLEATGLTFEALPELRDLAAWAAERSQVYRHTLPQPHSAESLELAELYEGVALACLRLASRSQPHRRLLEGAAAVQSRLRYLLQTQQGYPDEVQRALYGWLRQHTAQARVRLNRHMRLDDPATFEEAQAALGALRRLPEQPASGKPGSSDKVARLERRAQSPEHTPEVAALRRFLGGRTVLLVGSTVTNPGFLERCAGAGIRVRWRTFAHGESPLAVESDLRQPEVAVVAVLIRWAAHALSELRPLCQAHGRHFVRIPAGYSLNTLASEVLEQVGGRLAA